MCRLFMDALDDLFQALDRILAGYRLGRDATAIVIDFHAEATSEKTAFGHFADGRVSAVVGTHTHIPTADAQILPWRQRLSGSDAGMCGTYDSVIGMDKGASVRRFVTKMPSGQKPQVAEGGEGTLCGVFVETHDTTGLARRVEPVRLGGRLAQHLPRDVTEPEGSVLAFLY